MKKRIVFKNWFKNVLLVILFITMIVGAMDFESTKTFMIVHLIDGAVMMLVGMALWVHTDLLR